MFELEGGGHRTFLFRTFGTMCKIGRGHRTYHLRVYGQMFKLRGGHRTRFKHKILIFLKIRGGGTPHIQIEVFCLDVQTKVGPPHKIQAYKT